MNSTDLFILTYQTLKTDIIYDSNLLKGNQDWWLKKHLFKETNDKRNVRLMRKSSDMSHFTISH